MKTPVKILFFLAISTLFTSCGKDGITAFDMDYSTSFTVQSTTGINTPLSLPTPDITTNSSAEFKKEGTSADLVKEVKLTSAKLTITSPSGKTFSFLKSVHIFISSNGLPEIEIAYADNVPNTSAITLTTTGVLLDKYIKASSFKISAKIVTDETILQDITIRSDLLFHVKADLL